MKRIVVYFSLEGNTEYIADEWSTCRKVFTESSE
ncbi:flavodoxin family protein [Lachnobacterium bovis]|nr:flavodoxin family protein [Lachnobacterium bovis]